MENNSVHLCNSCCKSYPECSDDEHSIEFGDGIGNDNICCCNKYEPLMEHDYDRDGIKMFCIHKWHRITDKPIYDYFDYSGFHVCVFLCKCSLCGKVRKKKFY